MVIFTRKKRRAETIPVKESWLPDPLVSTKVFCSGMRAVVSDFCKIKKLASASGPAFFQEWRLCPSEVGLAFMPLCNPGMGGRGSILASKLS